MNAMSAKSASQTGRSSGHGGRGTNRSALTSGRWHCHSRRKRTTLLAAQPVQPSATDQSAITKARRADVFVEKHLQINNKLRQERHSLTSRPTRKTSLLTELEEPFSGCFYKYFAPNGATKALLAYGRGSAQSAFRIPQSTVAAVPTAMEKIYILFTYFFAAVCACRSIRADLIYESITNDY